MEKTISDIAEMSSIDIQKYSITSKEQLKPVLSELIAYLIDHDFEKLLWILYRIDVDEEKAKKILSEHLPADAPAVLADLIITRQQKKEELKKQFEQKDQPSDDDELRL